MAKKHWIYVKRGLSEDPKHRAAMGECIWLFLHIIDRADWETGVAYDWKDKQEAADMGMPVDTLRKQRQKLEELGYIRCVKRQYSQDIYIFEWKNPRDYSAAILNPRVQSSLPLPPQPEGQSDQQSDRQSDHQLQEWVETPTLDSESESYSEKGILSESEIAEANALVDAVIENARKAVKYSYRNEIPEPYLAYADAFVELTGLKPKKKEVLDWIASFSDWQSDGLTVEDIRATIEYANREGGFPVVRPGSLTRTANWLKAQKKNTPAPPERVYVRANPDEKREPVPDFVLEAAAKRGSEAARRLLEERRKGQEVANA